MTVVIVLTLCCCRPKVDLYMYDKAVRNSKSNICKIIGLAIGISPHLIERVKFPSGDVLNEQKMKSKLYELNELRDEKQLPYGVPRVNIEESADKTNIPKVVTDLRRQAVARIADPDAKTTVEPPSKRSRIQVLQDTSELGEMFSPEKTRDEAEEKGLFLWKLKQLDTKEVQAINQFKALLERIVATAPKHGYIPLSWPRQESDLPPPGASKRGKGSDKYKDSQTLKKENEALLRQLELAKKKPEKGGRGGGKANPQEIIDLKVELKEAAETIGKMGTENKELSDQLSAAMVDNATRLETLATKHKEALDLAVTAKHNAEKDLAAANAKLEVMVESSNFMKAMLGQGQGGARVAGSGASPSTLGDTEDSQKQV